MSRNAWLIAFADLSAVLCAFFVMMLAMSDFDAPALDRIATVFGTDEGSWVGDRQTVAPQSAVRRLGDDGAPQRDYLAAVMSNRLAHADWPWTLEKRTFGVALVQTIPPGGPVLPVGMAEYIQSLGFPLRISTVMSRPDGRIVGTIGDYDDGLRNASVLADSLRAQGARGPIPTAARYAEDDAPHRIEIILDSGVE
jgi:hypothetical protein